MEKEEIFVNIKRIVSLGIVLAGLTVLYIFLLHVHSDSNTKDMKLITFSVEEIARISIEYPDDESLIFEKTDHQWMLTTPGNLDYSQDLVDALPMTLSYVSADKYIDHYSNQTSEYGFDKPVTITVRSEAENENKILIGNETPTLDGYYILVQDKIYTLNSKSTKKLMLDSLSVLDPYVLGIDRTLRLNDAEKKITTISCINNGITLVQRSRDENGVWQGENTEICDEIANFLVSMRAMQFVKINDISEVGLDSATAKISFIYDGKTETLFIGNKTDDGSAYYAKTGDNDNIFLLSAAGLNFIENQGG